MYVFGGLSSLDWSMATSIEKIVVTALDGAPSEPASALWKVIEIPDAVGRVCPGVAHLNFKEIVILGGAANENIAKNIQIFNAATETIRTAKNIDSDNNLISYGNLNEESVVKAFRPDVDEHLIVDYFVCTRAYPGVVVTADLMTNGLLHVYRHQQERVNKYEELGELLRQETVPHVYQTND